MSESKMWASYRNKLPGEKQRIEDKYQPGIPDVNWAYNGKDIWIENKWVPTIIQGGRARKVHLRPEQALWLTKRKAQGSNVFVLLKCATGKDAQWWLFDDHFLELTKKPHTADWLSEHCLDLWYGAFDWERIWLRAK